MYDTSKLRGRIIEKYGSQKAFADATKGSLSFISQYLNGNVTLNQNTIDKWANLLDISAAEIPVFFFAKKVHETEHST